MEFLSKNIEETKAVAQKLLEKIAESAPRGSCVVALQGDLGAGKTTLVQQAAAILGVGETVISPTFIIEKIYKLNNDRFSHLIHIDAYRLESAQELERLGWHELTTDKTNLIFVEWPERVTGILPQDAIAVHLEFVNDTTRKISFRK
jgi:tRNA threonylcarbamoyladenosine biosynthesis protein TsaE